MKIPVKNVFYLLSYAWGEYRSGQRIDLGGLESDAPEDLLAHVLVQATRRLLQRGLDRGYETTKREVEGVRGQIDFSESVGRLLLPQGRTACRVDEFTYDVLHNRILKSTLARLSKIDSLDSALRHQCRALRQRFRDVSEVELGPQSFSRVQLDSNSRFYRLVMSVCRLVVENSHLRDEAGTYRFRDFLRDETQMHRVFEKFVREFYSVEQTRYSCGRQRLNWQAVSDDPEAERLLPGMETDVTLRGEERVLIIDTKYYQQTLASQFGSEHVRASHFAQIYAYLKNERSGDVPVEGMLLYPTVGRSLDLEYEVDGHRVRVCTLDLSADWRDVHQRLIELLPEAAR